jgi:lysophospholipase L1-like esterase
MNRESVTELIRLCNENHIRLLIVNIPEMHQFRPYRFAYATDRIRSLAAEGNVPFIDLLAAFSGTEPESLWVSPEDPHANAEAHSIIAQQICDKILNDRMLE